MDFNRPNPRNCPCMGCGDREIGCHGKCEKYKAWRQMINQRNEQEREFKKSRDTLSEEQKRRIWRKNRYQRKNSRMPRGLEEK